MNEPAVSPLLDLACEETDVIRRDVACPFADVTCRRGLAWLRMVIDGLLGGERPRLGGTQR